MNKISLGQLSSFLYQVLQPDEHFAIYDLDESYETAKNMSVKQYNYLLHLIHLKRYITAKQILDQLGFKHK